MIVIDAETGEYGIDSTDVETALRLKQKNPNARLFTIRIGYDVAVSFGGAVHIQYDLNWCSYLLE